MIKRGKTFLVQLFLGSLILAFVLLLHNVFYSAKEATLSAQADDQGVPAAIVDDIAGSSSVSTSERDVDAITGKGAGPTPLEEAQAALSSSLNEDQKNCRFGVSSWDEEDALFLDELGLGWTVSFAFHFDHPRPAGVEYVPMIRMKQRFDPDTGERLPDYEIRTAALNDGPKGMGTLIANNPGTLWLVGNEVDRFFWQDDMMPDIYAEAYHDVYHFIKERDPSAQVGISGLVEVTPGRLQYLDIVWDSYLQKYGKPMPVDVWNMHVYILPEIKQDGSMSRAAVALGTDPDLAILESDLTPNMCPRDDVYCYAEHDDMGIFAEQVVAMRKWMKEHGQRNKPLILSEYSLLYPYVTFPDGSCDYLRDEFGNCFTPERVSQFMVRSFEYLESAADPELGYPLDDNRLVQQWLWFTMHNYGDEIPNPPHNLVEEDYSDFTMIGKLYRDQVAARRPIFPNLMVGYVSAPTVTTAAFHPSGTTSITLTATIVNNGDTPTTSPFVVTFYADPANSIIIDSVVVPAGLGGCARHEYTVSVTWDGLVEGFNPYWVVADSTYSVPEKSETDNTATGFALLNPDRSFLPMLIH